MASPTSGERTRARHVVGLRANLTYTPAANYNGPDSFTYVANDGAVDSAAIGVSLAVNAVNDAPAFTSPAIFAVAENSTTIGTVAATDIEGNPVSFAIAGGADQALFAIDPGGALRFIARRTSRHRRTPTETTSTTSSSRPPTISAP